jgi:hypothetical protein
LIIHVSEEILFPESVTNNLNISASPVDTTSGAVNVITSSPLFRGKIYIKVYSLLHLVIILYYLNIIGMHIR